ncbi:MAG TPA: LamG-like jellyroll fold domain-containing protein, partial [Chthoniobacterales bacterium]|nr:LamG-like jellyroll fold domain-containing protein [Chthoniobacterales bacterium]
MAIALSLAMEHSIFAQAIDYSYDLSGNLAARLTGTLAAPQILAQPQSQVVEPGKNTSFSVVLADAGGATYQWRFNGNPISGATNDALVITNVSAANAGLYSVIITNSAGAVTSANATLFIDADRDGLADSWEQSNFGNLAQNATGDLDNDGISNLNEFREGTNPNSNASYRPRLTMLSDGGGTVTVTPTKASYDLGEVVTLTATAAPPNTFHGWSGALATQANPETLTMSASKTVKAHFISTPVPAGVVSWWRAENDALDAIGNNNGALVNGVTFATGEVGQAFNFNAATQQVKVNASPTLNVGTGSGLTVEAWIKPTDLTERPIAEWNSATSSTSWGAHFWTNVSFSGLGGPGCLYANLKDINNVDHFFFSPTGLLTTTTWQHVAVTYDRTLGSAKLFLNGVAVASANFGNFIPNTASDLYLGSRPGGASYSGLMDEPALYNRALTADEIFAIHAAGPAGKNATPYFTSPSQLPEAVLAAAYSQQLSATFGTAPLTYALAANALPPGLSLSPAGVISGTPTTAGTYFFDVRVTDAAGQSTQQLFSLTVLAPVPPPAGTAAWWRAENNAQDSIGTNHGTLQNGATFATGKVGQAFNFNGSNQYVFVPNSSTLQSQTLSVDAWVYPRTAGSIADSLGGVIFTKDRGNTPGSQVSYALFGPGNTGRFTALVQFTDGTTMNLQSANTFAFNQWHHVAMTWNGSVLNLYVNGNLAASAIAHGTKTILYTNDNAGIGGHSFAARLSNALIDEVTVNNRALASSEVAAIFSAGPAGKTTAGPIINTPSALPDGYAGQIYSQAITGLRTSGPTIYSITNGALPPGLSLSSAGLLNGTPTTPGAYTFTVRLTDASTFVEQAFTIAVYASVSPQAGLVSWWRAENNANDAIGTNHGTLTNGATFAAGRVGQAFALDGGNDYVNIPDSASLQPTSITLEGWFNFSSSGGNPHLISRTIGTQFYNSFVLWLNSGTLRGGIGDSAGNGNGVGVPFSPVAGRWYHIAFTFDDTAKRATLYLDGAVVATNVSAGSIQYDNHPVLLGGDIDFGSATNFFNGRIDEAAIYNRALSTAEIASIYNAGTAGRTVTGPYFNTPATLPEAIVGTPYSHTITTLRGTAPVSFSVLSGSLPPGLSLDSSGLLSGTPTTAGSFSFAVRATDANTLKADQIFTVQVLQKVSPPAGIISWWRGQNDAQDSIGANHGTLTNGATFGTGKVGAAFTFDGVDDLITVPSINAGSKYTVEFWLYPKRAAGYEHLVSNSGGSSNYGDLYFRDNHIEYWQGGVLRVSSPVSSVPLFTWSHIALSYDSAVTLIYVNGVALAVSVNHSEVFNNPVAFGYTNAPSNNRFQGLLDEISLYDRALGSAEIALLSSAGSAGKTITGPYFTTVATLPEGTLGLSYSQTISSVRGAHPVAYSLVGGTLPPGVTLASNGSLSGTPTLAGDFAFTIRVTDNAGLFADQTFNLRISTRSRISLGAVSWWRAEGDAQDSVGANHGTLTNGATFTSGKVGQSFKLDGVNDYVSIPDAPSLRPTSLTIEGWFSFDQSNGIRVLVAKPIGSGVQDSYALFLENGVLKAFVGQSVGPGPQLQYAFTPTPGRWYHLAYTFDGATKQQALYVDRVLAAIGVGTILP